MSVWALSIGTSIGWIVVGMSEFDEEDSSTLAVFTRADRLMYQRKAAMKRGAVSG